MKKKPLRDRNERITQDCDARFKAAPKSDPWDIYEEVARAWYLKPETVKLIHRKHEYYRDA